MTCTTRLLVLALWTASALALASAPALAQEVEEDETETIEDAITVVGDRKAYRGSFEEIEIPAADQSIDEELLLEVGAPEHHAAVHHQPAPGVVVEVQVHPDLAGAAEREEVQAVVIHPEGVA